MIETSSKLCSARCPGVWRRPVGNSRKAIFACLVLTVQLPLLPQNEEPKQQPPKLQQLKTSITVNEKIAADAPASIIVVDSQEIQQPPGVNLDDRLRAVPGFTLFRRSPSLVAEQREAGNRAEPVVQVHSG